MSGMYNVPLICRSDVVDEKECALVLHTPQSPAMVVCVYI